MGVFAYPVTIIGPKGEAAVEALVDTAATYSWLPSDLLVLLAADPHNKRLVPVTGHLKRLN